MSNIEYDKIEKLHNSLIQHGKYNDRIYLMKTGLNENVSRLLDSLEALRTENNYGKIFAKVPASFLVEFRAKGYRTEAFIPDFYGGKEDVVFMSKFYDDGRKDIDKDESEVLEKVLKFTKRLDECIDLDEKFYFRELTLSDLHEASRLYALIFPTYPFPIFEEEYLIETFNDNVDYYGIFKKEDDKIVALGSSEKDMTNMNVEMTDFAVNPDYRGHNFAVYILQRMEEEMKNKGYFTAYTIARTISYGMNYTFQKMSYKYSGTVIKNTNISDRFESMNIWYKRL